MSLHHTNQSLGDISSIAGPLAPAARHSATPPVAPLRILVVEDDPDARRSMVRLLRSEGYVVYGAGTCEGAIRTAREAQPDVLITDHLLPDGNGLRVLNQINESRPEMFAPVQAILITTADSLNSILGSDSNHFAQRLVKPFDFSSVVAAIRSVVAGPFANASVPVWANL